MSQYYTVTMTHLVCAESADLALEAVLRSPTGHLNECQVMSALHFAPGNVQEAAQKLAQLLKEERDGA